MEKGHKRVLPGFERLRIILMFFMCIDLFGLPTTAGELIRTMCGFVPIAFFILSGYLVLRDDDDRPARILRGIKRTAIVFGVLFVVYFVMNLFYYRALGVNIMYSFLSRRFWFNFIVMNVWQYDIGGVIWYVQALLYAYIIIYFLDKWNLLKYDWIIAAALIVFTVITGELSGVIRWNILGYTYIPGNFLTRALPYILLGGILRRFSYPLENMPGILYVCGIVFGIILMLIEMTMLGSTGMAGYYGHMIGMPVVAVSVVMLAAVNDDIYGFEDSLGMSRWHTNIIYYICQPVSVGLLMAFSFCGETVLAICTLFIGLITFAVCFGIAWLVGLIDRKIIRKIKVRAAK